MKTFVNRLSLGLILIVCASCSAYADDAADVDKQFKTTMDTMLSIAKSTDLSDGEKRKQLWDIVLDTIDFVKVTEFTLGPFSYNSKANLGEYADRRFTKEQQDEFRTLFIEHLGNTYLDSFKFEDVDVKIDVKPAQILETKRDTKRARVDTIINEKTPVDYMVLNEGNGWKVYDIKVEERSLVSAFRTEYKNILIKDKPAVLIKMLKDKIAEHDSAKS